MDVAVVLVCCIIPCIGLVLGVMLMQMAGKREKEAYKAGRPSARVLQGIGRVILVTSLVMAVLTVVTLLCISLPTRKTRIMAAILTVTIQYFGALALIFVSAGMLQSDKQQRKEKKEENAKENG